MKVTEEVEECIRRLANAFNREKKRRAPEFSYNKINKRIAGALKLPEYTISRILKKGKDSKYTSALRGNSLLKSV